MKLHVTSLACSLFVLMFLAAVIPISVQGVGTTPSAPTNLIVVNEYEGPGTNINKLSWSAPTSDGGSPLLGYHLYRSAGGASYVQVAEFSTTASLSYWDPYLENGVTYRYYVTAFNANGDGALSSVVQVTNVEKFPGTPTNLAVTSMNGFVRVSWTAPTQIGSSSIASYLIVRGPSLSTTDTMFTTSGTANYYDDTSVQSGYTYYYGIVAENSFGRSAAAVSGAITYSPTGGSSTSTTPSPPTNVQAVAESGGIKISWSMSSDTSYRYYVYKGTSMNDMQETYDQMEQYQYSKYSGYYIDTNVVAGQTYFYYVVAESGSLTSEPSTIVTATASVPPSYGTPTSDGSGLLIVLIIIAAVAVVAVLAYVVKKRKAPLIPPPVQSNQQAASPEASTSSQKEQAKPPEQQ